MVIITIIVPRKMLYMYVDIDEDGGKLAMVYNTKWQPFLRIYKFLQSKHHIKQVF